ncbi:MULTISPECIES: amino acid adenylation domain-containing protein [Actinosynnema]|uniref:non-ribosomal peptide synthetase n=1 Tax=Actinosynnema TaxID=40566 RepID=UPI0020A2DD6B|nr:amino acid adenylation domain-containing protein [Actinosynnema pretiosum]MCP2097810.1 amino acid adenylation domain-containing protein [Actinosynnema pretiosum]
MAVLATSSGFPLTEKEQAQWMLHRLAPGRGICNIGFALRVGKPLRWWPLQEALNHVIRRHPALRTTVRGTGSRLRKHIAPAEGAEFSLSTCGSTEEDLDELLTGFVAEALDVENGPLIKAHLVFLPASSVLCVVLHHLVGDAITVQIVVRELIALYDAFAEGRPAPVDLAGPVPLRAEPAPDPVTVEYWTAHLAGVDAGALALASAEPTPTRPTFAGGRLDVSLSPEAVRAVARLRSRTRSTDNIVLLAAYYLLLARHGAGPDLVAGVLTNARRGRDESALVGYHVNTLPVRVRVDPGMSFAELVTVTRTAFLGGLEHGEVSFEDLQHDLGVHSTDWRVPLFRHSFNFRPTSYGHLTIGGERLESVDAYHGMSRLDLELIVWTEPDVVNMTALFSTEVHQREDVEAVLARYDSLLIAVDAAVDAPLAGVDIATPADRELSRAVNDTHRSWGPDTVADRVRARATAAPGAPAVGTTTYGELLARASGVRDELVRRGVRSGDVVGIYATRGPSTAAAVLGVWAAGAAYLPLDPAHPAAQAAYELADSSVRVVLADRPVPDECGAGRAVVALEQVPAGDLGLGTAAGPLAYVIYTSGSTGRPKGVQVTHANLVNVVRHFAELLAVSPADRMLWLTTFSFDISALELLVPLVTGARVVVADDEVRADPAALAALIEVERVTAVQATPTTWRQLAPAIGERLRGCRVLCGGEPLTTRLAEQLLACGVRLFNVYGPTETTIWSTAAELTSPVPERVPIGSPIANTEVFVYGPDGRPVLPGNPGELVIAGVGVAVGYRGDPARTAAAFRDDGGGLRHYRTGDLVRQRPDGQLEFIGRTDRQAKVRGHRVEPDEVESVLEEHAEVSEVAVLTESDPAGHLRLVAAVRTGADRADRLPERLREHAACRLPAAVVPTRFVLVDAFPLTGNGKVDHRALARLVAANREETSPLPADPFVRTVVELWREVLGHGQLSDDSNFFLTGGHSLLAVELADRVTAVTGHPMTFDMVFEAPTPGALAALLLAGRSEP